MATSVASPRMVQRKTIITDEVPAEEVGKAKRGSKLPVFDFLAACSPQQFKDNEIVVYLYRYHPQTEKKMAVEKFMEAIDPFSVKRQCGGGSFNVMVKQGPELIYNEDFEIEGEARVSNGSAADPQTAGSGGNITLEAMRMAMNPDIMKGMFQMFQLAATESMQMIRAQMPAQVDPLQTLRNAKEILGIGSVVANPMDDLFKQFMTAAITKLLNPPETNSFKETMGLVNEIKSSGLFGVPAKADLTTTLLSSLPMIADRVVSGLHEFRMQAESNERTVRLQRGEIRPTDPNVITMDPPAAAQPAAAPPPATGFSSMTKEQEALLIIKADMERLAQAMKQPECTGEDIYLFLRSVWPAMLEEMSKYSKDQLLMFFRSAEMQRQNLGTTALFALAEDPRLPRMIDEFLSVAKENTAPPPAAAPGSTV